jgi:hypothetical protein
MGSDGIPPFQDPRRSFFIDLSVLRPVFRRRASDLAATGYMKVSNAINDNRADLVAQWIRVNDGALRLPI